MFWRTRSQLYGPWDRFVDRTDPSGLCPHQTWDIGGEAVAAPEPHLSIPQILTNIRPEVRSPGEQSPILVLDSIDLFLVDNSLSHVLRLIRSIQRSGHFSQLVVLASLPVGPTLATLSRQFEAVIHLGADSADSEAFVCRTLWTGEGAQKLTFTPGKEKFYLNAQKDQIIRIDRVVQCASPPPVGTSVATTDSSDSLGDLSTFNLKLSDNEREARSRLVLPFWKTGRPESQKAESEEPAVRIAPKADEKVPSASSHIYYEPDEVDDWDEEDPDDDLDF
ncbi:hypothetical protein TCAL_14371 [Tigriopus californicus]|uniref:Elongator complex protein 5 n=1 Tax=Tigriopus californicus TaxID=6832 RepID=A0A553ND19_TIGCA|nr:hypothetical protein TCAL_14371 [Tigriopus californicus]